MPVEDEPGTVAFNPVKESAKPRKKGVLALEDDDEGSDDDKDDGDVIGKTSSMGMDSC